MVLMLSANCSHSLKMLFEILSGPVVFELFNFENIRDILYGVVVVIVNIWKCGLSLIVFKNL